MGIARASATNRRFVISDEAASALAVLVHAQSINLFRTARRQP
ncbi:hypothetical protein [Bosea sp. OK403]